MNLIKTLKWLLANILYELSFKLRGEKNPFYIIYRKEYEDKLEAVNRNSSLANKLELSENRNSLYLELIDKLEYERDYLTKMVSK